MGRSRIASEIMAIDPDGQWLRADQLADGIAAVASDATSPTTIVVVVDEL